MNISPKERFLDICHFKRPGDLCMLTGYAQGNIFWPQTLEEWIKQGAPEEIIDPRFMREYFQFEHIRWLAGQAFDDNIFVDTDLGNGITIQDFGSGLIIPAYEPRLISEDERTVTYKNGRGQTVRTFKEYSSRMPIFLDWPVKDRATWNEYKKRLNPDAPERWPSDWNTYVKTMNAKSEPLSLHVGGFYGSLREWVGSENILYMFYDDPNLVEDMIFRNQSWMHA